MKYGSLPKHKSVDGQYPIFTGYKTSGYSDEFNVEDPEIVVVARGVGGTGDVKMAPGPAWITNLSIIVRVNPDLVNKKYLQLKLAGMGLRYLDSGSAQSQITIKDLSEVKIDLPDLDVQTKVAKTIQMFEDKISNLQAINDNLLELASALVNHSSQTQGRETTPLNDVLSSEKVISKSVQDLDRNAYISTTNMLPGKAGVTSDVDLPASGKAKIYKPGDILIANIRPYFKKIWFSDKSGSYSNDVLNFRANDDVLSREFLWGLLYSDDFFDYVVATSKGTKMPRGDKNAIAKYELRIPDDKEVQRITKVISPMLEMVSVNNLEISNLTQTRDALLSKLID